MKFSKEKGKKGISCQDKPSVSSKTATAGLTLVALVVTVVILLILVGITLVYLFGDNGVFKKAQEATEQTAIAKAREKLEIVLQDFVTQKHTDDSYNETTYINAKLISQNMQVEGNVVTVDGYQFEIDRSVPKISYYIGSEAEEYIPVTEIKIDQEDIFMAVGDTNSITILTEPSNATNSDVELISSNSEIVEISAENTIIGKKFGTVTLTAKSKRNSSISSSITVKVGERITFDDAVFKEYYISGSYNLTKNPTTLTSTGPWNCVYAVVGFPKDTTGLYCKGDYGGGPSLWNVSAFWCTKDIESYDANTIEGNMVFGMDEGAKQYKGSRNEWMLCYI